MKRAVLGCDLNVDYSFLLPIACLAWRRMGWRPLVLLVGKPSEWLGDPRHRLEVERSRETGAEIHWFGNFEGVRTSTVAQVSRIFASAVPGVEDGDLLMTSDVDMIPLGPWVGGGIDGTKRLHLFYANAYEQSYPHWPMCYVAAEARMWKEIVGGNLEFALALDLRQFLAAAMVNCPKDKDDAWNYDERLLGEMIWKWGEKGVAGHIRSIPRTFVEGEWRIDRSDWDGAMAEVEKRGSLAGVADAHVLRPGFSTENWPRIRRVLELALPAGHLAWIDDYHERWMKT